MKIEVRKAAKEDMPAVLELINELAEFEKEPDAVEVSVADLERDGFGERPLFECFVAETDGKIEGMALFYYRYSTWKGKTIHLEDLVVREEFRGKGLGGALYNQVIEYSRAQGCKRTEWVVLDWNTKAVEFYKKTGATVFDEWRTVQMDEAAMQSFCNKRS
ncbi:GNAT family N-acetyltransferase [Zunongwangia endophytica]|uniref:GNAT family N-acetyltransferase n=1 Tax=Zunongwangia endophytica TaxID=1808945 RepID=A0ABV8H5X4_9FLAO|nr:GNAT family N-acetyltransferase [Zunongwangia endophytica]MDN3596172.1 GNAT family N-acetyltransferase [Zunongwangia endophytica]